MLDMLKYISSVHDFQKFTNQYIINDFSEIRLDDPFPETNYWEDDGQLAM